MVKFSRRTFSAALGVAGSAVALEGLVPGWLRQIGQREPVPLCAADFKALTDVALARAQALGCAYAAIRITRHRDGSISHPAGSRPDETLSVAPEVESERLAFVVRVVHSGSLGSAEGSTLTKDTIAQTTARAVARARAHAALPNRPATTIPRPCKKDCWVAPHDPFDRPFDEHLASLVAANNQSARTFVADETYFVSSKGAFDHSATLSVA